MNDYARSRALSRIFVKACLRKIERIRPVKEASNILGMQYMRLGALLQQAIIFAPDTIVAPLLWNQYQVTIEEVCLAPPSSSMVCMLC